MLHTAHVSSHWSPYQQKQQLLFSVGCAYDTSFAKLRIKQYLLMKHAKQNFVFTPT